jgi:hypothetical protein
VLDGLLTEGADLADEYPFLDSWFEDGDQVQALLGGKPLSRARREAVVLEQVLDPRRRRWADLLAWTAFQLSRSDEDERWWKAVGLVTFPSCGMLPGRPWRHRSTGSGGCSESQVPGREGGQTSGRWH